MQMKNFISTLAMLFIFFAIAIVTWLLSRQSEEREKLASPLNAEVDIEGMLDPCQIIPITPEVVQIADQLAHRRWQFLLVRTVQ